MIILKVQKIVDQLEAMQNLNSNMIILKVSLCPIKDCTVLIFKFQYDNT